MAPRYGLKNESEPLPASGLSETLHDLADTDIKAVEVTAFISKKRVPRLAGAKKSWVMFEIWEFGQAEAQDNLYLACVPKMRGLKDALATGAKAIILKAATIDLLSRNNEITYVDTTMERYAQVIEKARSEQPGIVVRANGPCALGCPYFGIVWPSQVWNMARTLLDIGCDESLWVIYRCR